MTTLQNHATEAALLGTMILQPDATVPGAVDRITAATFTNAAHGALYQAIVDLYREKQTVARGPLEALLQARGHRPETVHACYVEAEASHRAPLLMDELTALEQRRRIVEAATRIARAAHEPTVAPSALIDIAAREIADADGTDTTGRYTMAEAVERWVEAYFSDKPTAKAWRTGFLDLDRMTGGIKEGQLILVAGRPGMGKSVMKNALMVNLARAGCHVLAIDLEMSESEQLNRLAASIKRLDAERVEQRMLSAPELGELRAGLRALSQLPIVTHDRDSITPAQLDALIIKERLQGQVDAVVIDYAQIMSTGQKGSLYEKASYLSRQLKRIARRHKLPLIALAQLSRAVEARDDKRPVLSDLRDSGTWEQDADGVWFVYRDEYYTKEQTAYPFQMDLIVAKNRGGRTGSVPLFCDMSRFYVANSTKGNER